MISDRRLGPYLAITLWQMAAVAIAAGLPGLFGVIMAFHRGATEVGLSLAAFLGAAFFALVSIDAARRGWIHPVVALILVFVVHVGIRPVLGYGVGMSGHIAVPWATPDDLDRAMALHLLLHACACIAVALGYALLAQTRAPPTIAVRVIPVAVPITGMLAAAVVTSVLVVSSGGIERFFLNLLISSSKRDYGIESGIAQFFSVLISVGVVAGLAAQFQANRWVAICGALVGATCAFAIAGRRSGVLFSLIATVAARAVFTHRLRFLPLAGIAVFGVALISLVGEVRLSHFGRSELSFADSGDLWNADVFEKTASESNNRANEESAQIALLAIVPERMPFLWGQSYATLLLAPVPRAIYSHKPRGTDYLAGSLLFDADWGIPVGSVAEAWWNFGLPGVVLVFFFYGAMLALLCRWYEQDSGDWTAVAVVVTAAVTLQPATNAVIPFMQFLALLGLLRLLQAAFRRLST